MPHTSLDPDKIIAQIERLSRRIQERFPDSGLYDVSGHLIQISQRAKRRAEWISSPIIGLRTISCSHYQESIGKSDTLTSATGR